jgi:hypothetical protein
MTKMPRIVQEVAAEADPDLLGERNLGKAVGFSKTDRNRDKDDLRAVLARNKLAFD